MSKKLSASLLLLVVAVVWGAGFIVMRNTLDEMSPNYVLAFRFTTGAVGLSFILFRIRHKVSFRDIMRGLVVGICLYSAYTLQTLGLLFISVSKNAMISAIYVILVPFLMWIFKKKRPDLRSVIAALICFVGVALLSLSEGDGSALMTSVDFLGIHIEGKGIEIFGIIITALSGVMYGMHIAVVNIFSEKMDVMPITFFQFFFAAIFAWIAGALFETFPDFSTISTGGYISLAYVCLFATLLALTLQNIGLQNAPPVLGSMILCTESLFACLLSVFVLHEQMSFMMGAGCVLIMAALLTAQLQIKRKNKPKELELEAENNT